MLKKKKRHPTYVSKHNSKREKNRENIRKNSKQRKVALYNSRLLAIDF